MSTKQEELMETLRRDIGLYRDPVSLVESFATLWVEAIDLKKIDTDRYELTIHQVETRDAKGVLHRARYDFAYTLSDAEIKGPTIDKAMKKLNRLIREVLK